MSLHPVYAIGVLLVGWFGFALRRTSIGGVIAGLIAFEGLLVIASMAVFLDRRGMAAGGSVLLWVLFFGVTIFLVAATTLGLRQYFAHRSVSWKENEELRH